MFIKLTRSGPNQYVQLVEAFRDDTGRPKQRTVATLGRLDQLGGELKSVISGLQRVTGQLRVAPPPTPTVSFEAARDFGDVWALTELWNSLGFDRLRKVFRRTRHSIDVEALIRIMVLNRLCDPDSKLGVLRWLQKVSLPGVTLESVDHPCCAPWMPWSITRMRSMGFWPPCCAHWSIRIWPPEFDS